MEKRKKFPSFHHLKLISKSSLNFDFSFPVRFKNSDNDNRGFISGAKE